MKDRSGLTSFENYMYSRFDVEWTEEAALEHNFRDRAHVTDGIGCRNLNRWAGVNSNKI